MSYFSNENTGGSLSWVKVTKNYLDFAFAGLSNEIEIYSLPAKSVCHGIAMHHTESFQGGAISTYQIKAGIPGNTALYVVLGNVKQAPGDTVIFPAINNSGLVPVPRNMASASPITATAVATGANLDQANQGSVDFYLLVSTLP